MKVASVILARVLAFVETFDLSPKGTVYYPDLVKGVVEKYAFAKFPQSYEQLDEQKGVEFYEGRAGSIVIQKFTIFNSLLVLETRSSTDDSKRILEEMLSWGAQKFGLTYQPSMIKRFAYVSALSFHSDAPLLTPSRAITNLGDRTGRILSDVWGEQIQYQGLQIMVGHDPLERKYGIAPFYITRRAEAKFSEGKYFSEAPLPTKEHLELLAQYEKEISL